MLRSDLLQEHVPLAGLTTLEVGGPARYLARATNPDELRELLGMARRLGAEPYPIGEGSNLLASDEGFPGMLLQSADESLEVRPEAVVRAGAGRSWDELVAATVEEGLAGLECLSGIPGLVGAAPIQNVGAYGQDVAETLTAVEALDRATGELVRLPAGECGFGYRMSHFKGRWRGRYVVTRVEFALRPRGAACVRYGDLQRRFGMREGGPAPSLSEVRQGVLEVRRSKSMVRDPQDPNRRSAGSFFMNPVVPDAEAERLGAECPEMPVYPAGPGMRKLSAAWLIEGAGLRTTCWRW